MTTHSSTLAWRIPRTEKPGGLQSMGSQSQTRLKRLSTHAHMVLFSQHTLLSSLPVYLLRIFVFCCLPVPSECNVQRGLSHC